MQILDHKKIINHTVSSQIIDQSQLTKEQIVNHRSQKINKVQFLSEISPPPHHTGCLFIDLIEVALTYFI